MVAQPLSLTSGQRLGRGSVLEDVALVDEGIDHGLLTRAELLLEWVEENEVPAEPDRCGTDLGTAPEPPPWPSAGADELGARRMQRDADGVLPERAVVIAGEGAPLVSDLGLVDLAATLRRSVISATRLVGGITELGYRLPFIWERCRRGGVPLWRALRVAEKTMTLPAAVAAEVDVEMVSVLGSCSWAQVDRCIQAALTRHENQTEEPSPDDEEDVTDDDEVCDPPGDTERVEDAEDPRNVRLYLDDAGTDVHMLGGRGIGLTGFDGLLDDADALDLEQAIRGLAAAMARAGSTEPLGVRRAKALGMLARGEAPLPVGQQDAAAATAAAPGSRRHVLLVLHLTQAALDGDDPVGRCENTLAPASVEQIRDWCTGATVKVQPVLDIAAHHPVGSYEIPDRLRNQVRTRDLECVFPHCHRPARACDLDHITPYPEGPTCACNLAPLCRRHHRAKTARRWTYLMVHPGTYYWCSPSGVTYLVDAHGTHRLPDLGVPRAADQHRRRCPSERPGRRSDLATRPGRPPTRSSSGRTDRSPGTGQSPRQRNRSTGGVRSTRPPPGRGPDDPVPS